MVLRFRRFWWTAGLLSLVIIMYQALKPLPGDLIIVMWSDKMWHMFAFVFLFLWFAGLLESRNFPRLAAILFFYGLAIEFLQIYTPNRNVELADAIANVLGILIGWWLANRGARYWIVWLESKLPG